MLGAASSAERDTLINWERGQDLDDEDVDAVTSAEMRPSAHGDVLHSRPVALNFGTAGSPQVVVFYGGNDGVLRAINGNRATAIGSKSPPAARSGLSCAPEFYTQIKRLRDNSTPINFTGSPAPPPAPRAQALWLRRTDHGLPGREQRLGVREHAPRRPGPVRLQRHGRWPQRRQIPR